MSLRSEGAEPCRGCSHLITVKIAKETQRVAGRRRWAVPVGLAVIGSLTAGCDGGSPPERTTENTPPGQAATTSPAARSEDGGKVRVTERGFTSRVSEHDGHPKISYGFVLENTSKSNVVAFIPQIGFIDGSGRALKISEEKLRQPVVLIPPGQRRGVGNTFGLIAADKASRMNVRISEVEWYPPGTSGTGPFPKITASRPEKVTREKAWLRLTFAATLSGRTPLVVTTYALFRDSAGKIIGGSAPRYRPVQLKPGKSEHTIRTWDGVPDKAEIAEDRTEIYLYPKLR